MNSHVFSKRCRFYVRYGIRKGKNSRKSGLITTALSTIFKTKNQSGDIYKKNTLYIFALINLVVFVLRACATEINTDRIAENTLKEESLLYKSDETDYTEDFTKEAEIYRSVMTAVNNGHFDESTEVSVIIETEGQSLIERWFDYAYKYYDSLNEFILSSEGSAISAELEKTQNKLIKKIEASGVEITLEFTYTSLLNGIAVNMRFCDVDSLLEINGI